MDEQGNVASYSSVRITLVLTGAIVNPLSIHQLPPTSEYQVRWRRGQLHSGETSFVSLNSTNHSLTWHHNHKFTFGPTTLPNGPQSDTNKKYLELVLTQRGSKDSKVLNSLGRIRVEIFAGMPSKKAHVPIKSESKEVVAHLSVECEVAIIGQSGAGVPGSPSAKHRTLSPSNSSAHLRSDSPAHHAMPPSSPPVLQPPPRATLLVTSPPPSVLNHPPPPPTASLVVSPSLGGGSPSLGLDRDLRAAHDKIRELEVILADEKRKRLAVEKEVDAMAERLNKREAEYAALTSEMSQIRSEKQTGMNSPFIPALEVLRAETDRLRQELRGERDQRMKLASNLREEETLKVKYQQENLKVIQRLEALQKEYEHKVDSSALRATQEENSHLLKSLLEKDAENHQLKVEIGKLKVSNGIENRTSLSPSPSDVWSQNELLRRKAMIDELHAQLEDARHKQLTTEAEVKGLLERVSFLSEQNNNALALGGGGGPLTDVVRKLRAEVLLERTAKEVSQQESQELRMRLEMTSQSLTRHQSLLSQLKGVSEPLVVTPVPVYQNGSSKAVIYDSVNPLPRYLAEPSPNDLRYGTPTKTSEIRYNTPTRVHHSVNY